MKTRRRIFISFDHDDTDLVNGFLGLRNMIDELEFYNHKLDHEIQSKDVDYICRVIREKYIVPASVCVVLIGDSTSKSDWVRWELQESRRLGKGLLGIHLKGKAGQIPAGIPDKHVGGWSPEKFVGWIEWAFQNRTGPA